MPLVIPLAVGFMAGVCVAPSIRRQPKLQRVIVVVDAFTETVKDAYRNVGQAIRALACPNRNQPVNHYSLN